jgi:adenosylcobyric acid synthase
LAGTDLVLSPEDKKMIKGFIINKFRGDTNLFSEGMTAIESFTGWAGIGILPFFDQARLLPAEDILDIDSKVTKTSTSATRHLKIAVPMLRRIANFDDLDPLAAEPYVEILLIKPGDVIPPDCDLILLPGSKATIADLRFLRDQGWDIDIQAHQRRGGHVLGLCGGYQMLGHSISDPHGIEGAAETIHGLGLLDIDTILDHSKTLRQTKAVVMGSDIPVTGYEIHMGVSTGAGRDRPFLSIDGVGEGAMSADGRVIGSYCHGLFTSNQFRTAFLAGFGVATDALDYDGQVDAVLDRLAGHMATHLDLDALGRIAGI